MSVFSRLLRSDGLFARAMRSSMWASFGFAASQLVRFMSNVALTHILFPEAFGLMALVAVCLTGLTMFSDIGIGPSIMRSSRGDDPVFLDTAWTLQVIRGFCLWLVICVLAWPVSRFYDQPLLMQLLPVAGLTLLINGFSPTRVQSANRHLQLGRVISLDLISQICGILITIAFAWATKSVWGLAVGNVVGSTINLFLMHTFLAGPVNRFRLEKADAYELVHFGKWIFLSTVGGFLLAQGDKAILGKYINVQMLGIYNIGYFLASFPILLGGAITGRILIPLYREVSTDNTPDKTRRVRLMRMGLTGAMLFMQFTIAFAGVAIVGLLYDSRYTAAGPILLMISLIQIPSIIGLTYDQAALAAGDSRNFFYANSLRAIFQTSFFIAGAEIDGLTGALIGQGLSALLLYSVTIWLARKYKVWDPLHDGFYASISVLLGLALVYVHYDSLMTLF